MANLRIIECSDCGWPRLTNKKNTKYCYLCRTIRNMSFVGDRVQKCISHGKRFAPLKRNEQMCLACNPYSTPGQVEGDCAGCGNHSARLYSEEVRVGVDCCLQDPKKRVELLNRLIQKQKSRINGDVEKPTLELPWHTKTDEELLDDMTTEEREALPVI